MSVKRYKMKYNDIVSPPSSILLLSKYGIINDYGKPPKYVIISTIKQLKGDYKDIDEIKELIIKQKLKQKNKKKIRRNALCDNNKFGNISLLTYNDTYNDTLNKESIIIKKIDNFNWKNFILNDSKYEYKCKCSSWCINSKQCKYNKKNNININKSKVKKVVEVKVEVEFKEVKEVKEVEEVDHDIKKVMMDDTFKETDPSLIKQSKLIKMMDDTFKETDPSLVVNKHDLTLMDDTFKETDPSLVNKHKLKQQRIEVAIDHDLILMDDTFKETDPSIIKQHTEQYFDTDIENDGGSSSDTDIDTDCSSISDITNSDDDSDSDSDSYSDTETDSDCSDTSSSNSYSSDYELSSSSSSSSSSDERIITTENRLNRTSISHSFTTETEFEAYISD